MAFDGQLSDTELVAITVNDIGFPPVLDPIGPLSVVESETLSVVITASDPDLVPPMLLAENLPANAVLIDSLNGHALFFFTPDYTQSGVDTVLFIASDGALADSEYVEITVIEYGNTPPILDPIGAQSVDEGDTLALNITAHDLDGTNPAIIAENLPTNATFIDNNDGTGAFSFMPDYIQAGLYTVLFYADDGEFADSEYVDITVNQRNGPPILNPIGPQTVVEGDSLGLELTAYDPDGQAVFFSADSLPANASFIDNGDGSALFSFLPDFTQAGIYSVDFHVSDGLLSDSELVQITVVEAGNQAPQFEPVDTIYSVVQGDSLGIIIAAFDPDDDPLTLALRPMGMMSLSLKPTTAGASM